MGGVGFFMDGLVIRMVRMVRRQSRLNQALGWSVADGRLRRFTTTSWGSPTLPLVSYSYQVNGKTQDGSATGFPIKDDQINQIGDVVDSLPGLRVRYDPANPGRIRILNEDNPRIPFKIDLLKQ
jgi:hypothetical protein